MPQSESADYIIIGAGSAGCVLANRLSAAPENRVLLLEAGGRDRHPLIRMPFAFMKLQFMPSLTWPYWSEPEPGLDGRRLWLPRGKVLGGTSSINGMVYARGHPADYDEWSALGATGWSWGEVLPYFRRSERSWRGDSADHGAEGQLTVSPVETTGPLHDAVMQTARALGHPILDDQHGPNSGHGFVPPEVTVDKGRRASSARQFLHPVAHRPNLAIRTGCTVTRIAIEAGRAVGVEIMYKGRPTLLRARREVILCAGTYNSPQLLMLSGIGPADDLRALSIDVVADLPGVGRNLQEHPLTGIGYTLTEPIGFESNLRFDRLLLNVGRFFLGRGDRATQLPVTAFGFMPTRPGLARPDIKANIYPTRLDARVWFPGIRKGAGHAMSAFAVLLRPESRGSVRLRSRNPADAPEIRINMYEDERDLLTMRRAVRMLREFFATAPLRDLAGGEIMPGSGVQSDADIDAYNRRSSVLAHHASSTCAMGADEQAVVDPTLRVRGIEGLRVADASVMPRIVGGNTNAPVIMIADKAADLILGVAPPQSG
ncbi:MULTISPECIES: GMC family oxidoreductase [unclassified Sphingobium]|uniref:GMC family oxidoreductase n=1 Tax=unclassified Sphingobium TaxID=2611147 RepID=UPI0022252177|nr:MULTISPECIES: GMC family oxidoreductase N-terminal domain-containing protein [unclassified Sphingobium]MCW2412310.1 choline dehydrogenase [Sphingobium sp. B8D3D]MCW2415393.1 choline dehydrogenase [Sphingobium sp. B8D3A]